MIAALVGFNLLVQNASTSGVLEDRTTADAVAIATTKKRKLVDSIQTVVI
jgi:hypothetical protein